MCRGFLSINFMVTAALWTSIFRHLNRPRSVCFDLNPRSNLTTPTYSPYFYNMLAYFLWMSGNIASQHLYLHYKKEVGFASSSKGNLQLKENEERGRQKGRKKGREREERKERKEKINKISLWSRQWYPMISNDIPPQWEVRPLHTISMIIFAQGHTFKFENLFSLQIHFVCHALSALIQSSVTVLIVPPCDHWDCYRWIMNSAGGQWQNWVKQYGLPSLCWS